MFDLVSSNQRDSIAMQQYLLEQLEHWRERTPGYIREFLQAYENGHRDWRTSVEKSLNELMELLTKVRVCACEAGTNAYKTLGNAVHRSHHEAKVVIIQRRERTAAAA